MDTHEIKSVDGLQFSIEVGYGAIDLRDIVEEAEVHRAEDEAARLDIENDHYGQLCDLLAAAVAEAENEAFIEWVEHGRKRTRDCYCGHGRQMCKVCEYDGLQFSIEVGYGVIDLRELVVEAERLFSYAIGVMGADSVVWLPRPEDREYPQETDEELFMEARYPTDADEQEILI